MSNPLQTADSSTASELRQRYAALRFFGAGNDLWYGLEKLTVTLSLMVMVGLMGLNILYQFLSAQATVWAQFQTGEVGLGALWPMGLAAVSLFALARSAFANAPAFRGNGGLALAFATITLLGFSGGALLMLKVESSIVVSGFAIAAGLLLIWLELERPLDPAVPDVHPKRLVIVGLILAATTLVVRLCLTSVPTGYSWAQKFALFLLLWISFIGASMATYEERHLTVDAIRKAIPARVLPWFNALSNLAAAIFSAGFCWLAWLYFKDRLVETAAPGEIPDSLKVAAIPVSLAFVTLRFLGHSVVAVIRGVTPAAPTKLEGETP